MNLVKKIKDKTFDNLTSALIFASGVVLRFVIMLSTDMRFYQHDTLGTCGHADYAIYMCKNWELPYSNLYEYAQPPLNAIFQAIAMKVIGFFTGVKQEDIALYSYSIIMTFIFSVITIIIVYRIILEFNLPRIAKNVFFGVMVFYPGLLCMSAQYGNDTLAYMFFYLSLYLAIKWCKKKDISTIVFLALSIGFGMLSKVSVGVIAFLIGPMMLTVWIRAFSKRQSDKKVLINITFQLILFALIVFPLGLSYSIRNLMLFGQKFGEIYDIAKGTTYDMSIRAYTIFDRYLSIPISRIITEKSGIFHDFVEYNVWVDLIKTSTFDEFIAKSNNISIWLYIIYFMNIAFWIIGVLSMTYNIIRIFIVDKVTKKNVVDLKNISLILFCIAIVAYLYFNIKYPRSCNSNYRYIAYITFALTGSIIVALMDLKVIKNNTI